MIVIEDYSWQILCLTKNFLYQNFFSDSKYFLTGDFFQTLNLFRLKMKDDLWREKTELLNLRLSKLATVNVSLKLEFDTEDQVLLGFLSKKT